MFNHLMKSVNDTLPPISYDTIKQMNLSDPERLKWLEVIYETEKRIFQENIHRLELENQQLREKLHAYQTEPKQPVTIPNEYTLASMPRLTEAARKFFDMNNGCRKCRTLDHPLCSVTKGKQKKENEDIVTPLEYSIENMKKLTPAARRFFEIHNGCKRCRTIEHHVSQCPRPERAIANIEIEPEKQEMMKKSNICVRNLNSIVDDETLRQIFTPFGPIKAANVIYDKDKQSRGYGFVLFEKVESAQDAIVKMNGKIVLNRTLLVEYGKNEGFLSSVNSNTSNSELMERIRLTTSVSNIDDLLSSVMDYRV